MCFLKKSSLLLSVALLFSCGGSSDDSSAPPSTPSEVTFYPETASPLMLGFTPLDGYPTTIIGTRDASGNALSIEGLQFIGPTTRSALTMNADGRPRSLEFDDSSTLIFTWDSEKSFVLSYSSSDGAVKFDSSYTLPDATLAAIASNGSTQRSLAEANVVKLPSLVNATLDVAVTQARSPVSGASVWANIVPKTSAGSGYNLRLGETTAGHYAAGFVNFPSAIPPGSIESSCNSILGAAATSCKYTIPVATFMLGGGCIPLAAGVTAAATPVAGAAALAACESGFNSALSACLVIRAGSGGTAGICQSIDLAVEYWDPDGATIKVKATKSGLTSSTTKDVPGRSTTVNIEVNMDILIDANADIEIVGQSQAIGNPITRQYLCNDDMCEAELFCTPPYVIGEKEAFVGRLVLNSESGAAVLDKATGSYDFKKQSVRLSETIPMENVTPAGSDFAYFSEGQVQLEGTVDPATMTVTGTIVHTVTTSWALDSSRVACTSTAAFSAKPKK